MVTAWKRSNDIHGSAQSTGQHLTAKNSRLRLSPMWVHSLCNLSRDILLAIFQSKKANFDASHELEELLLEDNPLKAKARKQNRDINTLSSEMRQMEEQCVESHGTTCRGLIEIYIDSRFTTSARCGVAHITRRTSRSFPP